MKYAARPLVLALSMLALACGSSDPGFGDPDGGGGGSPDAAGDLEWTELIAGEWTMPAGQEGYYCVRKTVTETMFIKSFRAINPLGTHHTVLTVGAPGGDDGVTRCNAGTNDDAMIFGSGVGGDAVHFPEGVAMKVEAGQQLLLNLHLFNISDSDLTDISGTEIITIPESEVVHQAEAILAGPTVSLQIPPGESTQEGRCLMNGDVTIFGIGPHLHQLGTHAKVVAESSVEGERVLHDAPYDFNDQKLYYPEPIEMKRNDALRVYCSYNNDTGATVGFGDSSLEEMCFATMYRYPAYGAAFGIVCDNSIF